MKQASMRWALMLATAFLAPPGWTAATLEGVVVINRGKGQPAAGVSVFAEGSGAGCVELERMGGAGGVERGAEDDVAGTGTGKVRVGS